MSVVDVERHPDLALREAAEVLARQREQARDREVIACQALKRIRGELVSGGDPLLAVQTCQRIVGDALAALGPSTGG